MKNLTAEAQGERRVSQSLLCVFLRYLCVSAVDNFYFKIFAIIAFCT